MAVADIGKVSIDCGDTHLLDIRGAASRAGKADIGRRLAAKVLGGDVAGERSAEFSIDPIAQCVGLRVPCHTNLVPAAVDDIAEIGGGREIAGRTSVCVDNVGVVVGGIIERRAVLIGVELNG